MTKGAHAALPVGQTIFSKANRRRFEHWTWVPPEGLGEPPYPLVLLLHGVYDASGSNWWQHGLAHETAHELVTSGAIPPVVVVMAPDTGAELGSGYCDWVDGTTRAETYVVDELMPWADANLPVAGADRYVSGLSMGGYGSLLLSLRHPGTFVSATSTSGFFRPDRLFTFVPDATERMWGSAAGKDAHDVERLVADAVRRAGLRLAFDCGTADHLLEQNRSFDRLLCDLGVDHGYAEHDGGHEWPYWRDHLADHLRFHFHAGGPLS